MEPSLSEEELRRMGDRVVDWYFDDNGVHKLEKNSALLDVVNLINKCAPKTEFWMKRAKLLLLLDMILGRWTGNEYSMIPKLEVLLR